jgi:uncharacterized membrane protein (DUF485 family)
VIGKVEYQKTKKYKRKQPSQLTDLSTIKLMLFYVYLVLGRSFLKFLQQNIIGKTEYQKTNIKLTDLSTIK